MFLVASRKACDYIIQPRETITWGFQYPIQDWDQNPQLKFNMPGGHIWELPVLRYHSIRGNYHYPFLEVNVSVILHNFIRQNYHKNQSDRYLFFLIVVNYPIFLINYHILYFQMYYQYLFFLSKYIPEQCIGKFF